MDVEFPAFRPRTPWLGADLQTLRNLLRGPVLGPPEVASERLKFPMPDGSGDVLSGRLECPSRGEGGALVLLIHGLSGCEDSAYLQSSAAFWLARGHSVLRLNLRGAGPSRPDCSLQYHAGRTADLQEVLRGLPEGLTGEGVFLVGYSLGGNMLLKFLAEHAGEFPIVGAASVSAPIDLAAASRRLLDRRNRIYHMRLLWSMRQEALGEGSRLTAEEARAVTDARSILEFDEHLVAPRNGFRDAAHYYAESNALRFLPEVRVPTLVVHALDDPWIPGEVYRDFSWGQNRQLVPLLPHGGGHVGFHARDDRVPWHDRCIARFLDSLAAGAPAATLAAS